MRSTALLFFSMVLLFGATAKEDKPSKRQLPGVSGDPPFAIVVPDQGVDPRQHRFDPRQQGIDPRQLRLDPRQLGLVDPRQIGLVDPRQNGLPFGVDARQFDGFGPQHIPGDPRQLQALAPQYEQLLRYIEGNPGAAVQPIPQLQQQNIQSGGPQQFRGQPRLIPVRLTPEQESANRAQESIASKSIREQEESDARRLQQLGVQRYLHQQGISPEFLRQLQSQPQFADPQIEAREAQARAQAEAQARTQADAQARAQADALARAQAEAHARAQADAHARAQAEAHARAQAEAQARAQARAQEEANRKTQEANRRAQEEANRRAHAEAEARVKEEQARAEAAQLAAQAQLHTPSQAPRYIFQDQQQEQEQVPETVSYSQVQFGSTKLSQPPRLFSSPPSPRQLVYLASLPKGGAPRPNAPSAPLVNPQPSPQPEYIQIPQHFPYRQEAQLSADQLTRYAGGAAYQPIPSVSVKQTPDQYLIETTKIEPSSRALNNELPPVAFRSSVPAAESYQQSFTEQQALIRQQQLEAATSPDTPSRSSIFVTTSRTPVLRTKPNLHHQGGRPLTQGELRALLNAGYKVQPQAQEQLYQPQEQYYQPVEYYQPEQARLGKRQNKPVAKPVPKPVPLTEKEKSELLAVGVRGLYRVDPQGKRGEHVKYVLAVGEPVHGQ